MCGLPLIESLSPCHSIAASPTRPPLSSGSATPTSAVFAYEGATLYPSSAPPGCNSESCLQDRDLLHHLNSTTDAAIVSANSQLDWQGLPTHWGGPSSPSSAHSLQLASSSRCDVMSSSSDVACWPYFGLEAMSADSACTYSQSPPSPLLPDPTVGRGFQGRSNATQHFNSTMSSVATSSDVRLEAVVSSPQFVPCNQSRGIRGGATCSPSAANELAEPLPAPSLRQPLPAPNSRQPLPAPNLRQPRSAPNVRQTRSSRTVAAAADSSQPLRRKRGRPRLYNTIVPVCDTATACGGIASMPDNGSTASMSVAYEPAPKRRGAKPKYVCASKEEAVAKRRDRNRATALATYYRRKAHTQELHSQLSDLREEAHALQALFDLVEHSTHCADWTGPLIAKGCAAIELLQVLLPDADAALDVISTNV